jgi:hypothetical protein
MLCYQGLEVMSDSMYIEDRAIVNEPALGRRLGVFFDTPEFSII